ncbi:MAG: pilus assembly protein, partial [bacterium]|nr:pilus assembly protein [bacterium]
MTAKIRRRLRAEQGSASIELIIMTPVIVILVGLALFTGRVATIKQDVISASRDSARAASARQFAGPAAA